MKRCCRRILLLSPILMTTALTACSDPYDPGQRAFGGALLGGGTGAAIGALAGGGRGAAIGALAGGVLGGGAGYLTTPRPPQPPPAAYVGYPAQPFYSQPSPAYAPPPAYGYRPTYAQPTW